MFVINCVSSNLGRILCSNLQCHILTIIFNWSNLQLVQFYVLYNSNEFLMANKNKMLIIERR